MFASPSLPSLKVAAFQALLPAPGLPSLADPRIRRNACKSPIALGRNEGRHCGWQCDPIRRRDKDVLRAAKGAVKKGFGGDSTRKTRDFDFTEWTQVTEPGEVAEGARKAVMVKDKGYVIISHEESVYAIEANCPACQFPVVKGKVEVGEEGDVGIECPLCHSVFTLADGSVRKWCPKDGLLTGIIGAMKEKTERTDALVKPARVSASGAVYMLFNPSA